MSIYTKNGDKGTTNLVHTKNVSKADDRIQLEGTIDELSCHIGVLKTLIRDGGPVTYKRLWTDTVELRVFVQSLFITNVVNVR